MRRIALSLFFAVALCAAPNVAFAADGEWQTLFNGKDLSGWRANTAPDSYAVSEGVLTLHNTSKEFRSHLFYVGEPGGDLVKFKNFDLRIVCKGGKNSNSGIFFHTDLAERDGKKHLGSGYEIQLNSAARDGRKTGSLYAIADIGTSSIDDTEWFELRILVEGKRIRVYLGGEQCVDYTEPENPERPENRKGRLLNPEGGAIALQAHDPDSTWHFKEIKIKRLAG